MAILDGRDLSTCRRFAGYLADRSICTSLVELDETHHWLWIRLASVSRFSVRLDISATDLLIDTLDSAGACAARCTHADGQRLLGADPAAEPGVIPHTDQNASGPPMRLYLHLGDTGCTTTDRIDVTFTRCDTVRLLGHLRTCRAQME